MSSAEIPRFEKPVFVLVAGAWHGGWAWYKVAKMLRARGYNVFAPTLTGLGERSHLANKEVGLKTHIQDICQVIKFESLEKVVLVGHSYGGLVAEGVADRLPQSIKHIVYLDAYLASDGQSIADLFGEKARTSWKKRAESLDGWQVPPPEDASFGVTGEKEQAWVKSLLTPQSLKTFLEPLCLSNPYPGPAARTWITCSPRREAPGPEWNLKIEDRA